VEGLEVVFMTFHRTRKETRPITWSTLPLTFDSGTQEGPHRFPNCRTGNRVGERYFAKDCYIVPGRRSALSVIVSYLTFRLQVVAFLMDVKVNGDATYDGNYDARHYRQALV
jgi:hypothetical protein